MEERFPMVTVRYVYLDAVGVKDKASEGSSLDVLAPVHDPNGPLSGLIRLEGATMHSIRLVDGTVQFSARRRSGDDGHVAMARPIRVDLKTKRTRRISICLTYRFSSEKSHGFPREFY